MYKLVATAAITMCVFQAPIVTMYGICANTKSQTLVLVEANRLDVVKRAKMVEAIVAKYKVDRKLAAKVVKLTVKYEHKTFPRSKDIIAIIGIESRFNPAAKSGLRTDPAIGLTQIRPQAWAHKIKSKELTSIDGQVRNGSFILAHYYNALNGDASGAIGAYNVGLRNYVEGKHQPAVRRYHAKYQQEVVTYQKIEAQYAK